MKKWIRLMFLISLVLIISITPGCENKEGKEDNLIKGIVYDKVIKQGFQSQGLSLKDILYEKTISESKMIFFTTHKALGIAYMDKDKDGWTFSRITPLTDFVSDKNPPSFMAGGAEVETPDGTKYFFAMGKIFNPNITKITLSNDLINTIIKEKDGEIFWFQLLEDKDSNENVKDLNDIKIYDKDNKHLN